MADESGNADTPLSRGDRQRKAIVDAVREFLEEGSFADLSVSEITRRAEMTRSGFYFYFDSKYAVLAVIFAELLRDLDELTDGFGPRGKDESPKAYVQRLVAGATAVFASNDAVMRACLLGQHSDAQIRDMLNDTADAVAGKLLLVIEQDGKARPISPDVSALVRILTAASSMMLIGDNWFLGKDEDQQRAFDAMAQLWVTAVWGG